ncbi:MAG: class I SAM-dependent methyltransferase [Acidimicrobiia bacterium]|nr:class I SAM-dependent methyltransferase [Acidimicrobiia bacterium]
MTSPAYDEIAAFYRRHPYPPPVEDLDAYAARWLDGTLRRVEHHRIWPTMPYRDDHRILVAGCGTSQAAKYAVRYPNAAVTGVDVSSPGIEANRVLADRHGLENLELHEMAIEDVDRLGEPFDLVVCTGVLHHLADPDVGLVALREVLAPQGAVQLMVYAPYGRTGVYMIQDYCRRVGVGTEPEDIADLVASLRELPVGHPLSHLLRDTRDFADADALADALLNPRDRAYSVPQLYQLVARADLFLTRWVRQAPYLPQCGAPATIPHASALAALAPADQHAAVELFRGTMVRHSAILHRDEQRIGFGREAASRFVPIRVPTVVALEERLPPDAALAVLDQAHTETDLVLFLDPAEKRVFESIDGRRTIGEITESGTDLFERLWQHDHIVIDASSR